MDNVVDLYPPAGAPSQTQAATPVQIDPELAASVRALGVEPEERISSDLVVTEEAPPRKASLVPLVAVVGGVLLLGYLMKGSPTESFESLEDEDGLMVIEEKPTKKKGKAKSGRK